VLLTVTARLRSGSLSASEMREVISEYTAEEVYSTGRQEIQDKIRAKALERLGTKMMEGTSGDESYNIAMQDTIYLYDTLLPTSETV
jgi:regulator of protease activity HflC (stomatin/prohibitin superfamily)